MVTVLKKQSEQERREVTFTPSPAQEVKIKEKIKILSDFADEQFSKLSGVHETYERYSHEKREHYMQKYTFNGDEWQIIIKPKLTKSIAHCDYNKKQIAFALSGIIFRDIEDLKNTLIHEITHAQGWGDHDRKHFYVQLQKNGVPFATKRIEQAEMGDFDDASFVYYCPQCRTYVNKNMKFNRRSYKCFICDTCSTENNQIELEFIGSRTFDINLPNIIKARKVIVLNY